MSREAIPRAMLICCEGKTEAEYFKALRRVYRIPGFIDIRVIGQIGQHKALIDRAVEEREAYAAAHELDEGEIEYWAVCDDDGMSLRYAELERYAEDRRVRLGFSRPQFECFLLQHFEQSSLTRHDEVFLRLSEFKMKWGGDGPYDESSKGDLGWLREAMFNRPKILDVAIANADIRNRQSDSPFLTVQALVRRLKGLQRG